MRWYKGLLVMLLCVAGTMPGAHATIATVTSVTKRIERTWGITMPETSARGLLDMSYLMKMVDTANEVLNGTRTSDYSHDPKYSHPGIVATSAANSAVDNLIRRLEMQFYVIPETTGNKFVINVAASGTFYFAWGDGKVERVDKGVGPQDISHTYANGANNYKVYIGGEVTGYPTTDNGAIWFGNEASRKVREVGGCMGCVFHTVGDGTKETDQPKFHQTFVDNSMLKTIPHGFFTGVYGSGGRRMFYGTFKNSGLTALPNNLFMGNELVPAPQMFNETFYGCRDMVGTIPESLFSGLVGAPSDYMFDNTFHDCGGLSGEIPEKLFGGISGPVAQRMFNGTFYGCYGLTGEIPSGLFEGVYGEPRASMFEHTFSGCRGLTSIGDGLFGDISGPAQGQMFDSTFYGCSSLTGPSATIGIGPDKQYLYKRWPNAVGAQAEKCYIGATNLDDYDCIPPNWGGPETPTPGKCEE